MAHASTKTKLPLATFAKIVGINPLHFSQVFFGTQVHCNSTLPQYTWQEADRISREEIAEAIAEAESVMERWLGFRLLPSWEVDEWFSIGARDARGLPEVVDAKWGYFLMGGVEAKSLILAGDDSDIDPNNWINAIIYSDEDNDGYFETATVTITVPAGTAPCEVEAYYPGKAGDDAWQIRPISVSISNVTATIVFRRELAVLPDLTEGVTIQAVDGNNDDFFLGVIDVYRRYNDPQTQATLMWEPGTVCGYCNGSGCAQCMFSTQSACLIPRGDPRLSMLAYTPSDWNAETSQFDPACVLTARQPDIVRLYYLAGYEDKRLACPRRDMDAGLQRAVAYLAASLLDRPPCDCSSSMWGYWNEDMAQGAKFVVQAATIHNPIGTRRGQVYAWNRLNDPGLAIGRGGLA